MDAQCIRCIDHQELLGLSMVGGIHIESFVYMKRSLLRVDVGQAEEVGGGHGGRCGSGGGGGEGDQQNREGEVGQGGGCHRGGGGG